MHRVDQCPDFRALLVVFTNNAIVFFFFNSHVDDTTNVMILNYLSEYLFLVSFNILHPIQLVHKTDFLELTSYTVNLAESYYPPLVFVP